MFKGPEVLLGRSRERGRQAPRKTVAGFQCRHGSIVQEKKDDPHHTLGSCPNFLSHSSHDDQFRELGSEF